MISKRKIYTLFLSFLTVFSISNVPTACLEASEQINQPMPDIENIMSAWKGHRPFAEWLVRTMQPKQIVDLGVDFGYSTFVFAQAARNNGFGTVTGVDLFEGDSQTSFRNTYNNVLAWISALSLNNVEIIKGDFTQISRAWNKPIDILHIDGYHSYAAVSSDFAAWHHFVGNDGVILFHDINVPVPGYEVIQFFRELNGGYKLYFLQSAGLGIYTKNEQLYRAILQAFPNAHDFATRPF